MTMRTLWRMARGAWKRTALLALLLTVPEEGAEPFTEADFNPFLASQRRRGPTTAPYDPAVLQAIQDSER